MTKDLEIIQLLIFTGNIKNDILKKLGVHSFDMKVLLCAYMLQRKNGEFSTTDIKDALRAKTNQSICVSMHSNIDKLYTCVEKGVFYSSSIGLTKKAYRYVLTGEGEAIVKKYLSIVKRELKKI